MPPQNAADGLLQQAVTYLKPEDLDRLQCALDMATTAHAGYFRFDGTPYLDHATAVAEILASWHAPSPILIAGLLHDVGKDRYATCPSSAEIQTAFGDEISNLVHQMPQMGRLGVAYASPNPERRTDNMAQVARQMPWVALTLQRMPYAAVIKLADRLHNFQTLAGMPVDRRHEFANRALNIFVPFAERLGMRNVKRQLEDYAFAILQPNDYAQMQQHYPLAARAEATRQIINQIEQQLAHYGLKAKVHNQPLSWYELYKQEIAQHEIIPLQAAQPILIIVDSIHACYRTLGLVHGLWPPQQHGILDYLAAPLPNGYRALHTRLNYKAGDMLLVVIHEQQLHRVAEYGIAADWLGVPANLLPELPSWEEPPEGQIAVFTKDGDLKHLPITSTPIDLAYAIHRNMGHNCTNARVNGRLVALTHPLQNGDVIEILTSRAGVGPSPEWLSYVQTSRARTAIRHWLTRQNRSEAERKGMDILDGQLRQEGILLSTRHSLDRVTAVAQQLGYETRGDLFVAIGLEQRTPELIIKLMKQPQHKDRLPTPLQATIVSLDDSDRQQRLAGCCNPSPPDAIVAYHNSRDELLIHRADCANVTHLNPLLIADWNRTGVQQKSTVEVVALARVGLARDVTTVIADLDIVMVSFHADRMPDGRAVLQIGLDSLPRMQVELILSRLRQLPEVRSVKLLPPTLPSQFTAGSVLAHRFANPYTLGPVTGQAFFGRTAELSELINNLRDVVHGEAVLLWGPRRIGKTSLLLHFREYLSSDDYVVAFIDMQRLSRRSTAMFLYEIIQALIDGLKDPALKPPQLRRMRRDALAFFRRFLENTPGLRNKHIVLIIDEFQLLSTLREENTPLSDINRYFRSLIQHHSGLNIIFSGGGVLDLLLRRSQTSFMLEVAHHQKIGCLDETAARKLIIEPVTRVQYDPPAVDFLLELTAGHPYYLQWVCNELIGRADREQRSAIARQHIDDLLSDWLPYQGGQFFNHMWGSSSDFDHETQQTYRLLVTAVAQLAPADRWISFTEIANSSVSKIMDQTRLWRFLQDLIKMDTLRVREEKYCIKVALFGYWLRSNHTIESVIREIQW